MTSQQTNTTGRASAVYSDNELRAIGFDPAQVHARAAEIMALFQLLSLYMPPNPDAVRFAAWSKARQLVGEVKL